MQSILFPEGFLIGALTLPPCHILLLQLVPVSPEWYLFLSQKHSLCVYGCAWSLVCCLPGLHPQHSCCSQPSSLCSDSSVAVGKGDFILGIFQSADPSHLSQTAVPGGCSDFQYLFTGGLLTVCDLNAVICNTSLGISPPPRMCRAHAASPSLRGWVGWDKTGCRLWEFTCFSCPELSAPVCRAGRGFAVLILAQRD